MRSGPPSATQGSDGPLVSGDDLAVYQVQRAHELELNKATAALEQAIVSALFLLNGGASVAFLTLLGAASAKESTLHIVQGLAASAVFTWAVALAVTAAGVYEGYRSQQQFTCSVSIRRQLMEHTLLQGTSRLRSALRDEPVELPEVVHGLAKKLQRHWLTLCSVALTLFILGVVLSAASIFAGA